MTSPPGLFTEPRVRITKMHRGRRISVSGALPEKKARKRLERLVKALPHDHYELTPVADTTTTVWRRS